MTSNGNGRRIGREEITVSTTEIPIEVHRTNGTPMIFAGLRQHWMSGSDGPDSFSVDCGAGVGSPYILIEVELANGKKVGEYIDFAAFIEARFAAIVAEHS